MFLVIFKTYIWSLRWDLKSSGRIAQNIAMDWLLQTKQRVMIFRLQKDSGRREADTECPEMSLTTNHNSQVMKKYRWKRTNKSGVGNIKNVSTLKKKKRPKFLIPIFRKKKQFCSWNLFWKQLKPEFKNVLSNERTHIFLAFKSFDCETGWCTDLQCWTSRSIICWWVGNDSWLELGYQCCSRGVSPAGVPWSYIIWKQQSVWDRKWTVVVSIREMSGEWIQFWGMFKRYPGVSEWPLLVSGNGPV